MQKIITVWLLTFMMLMASPVEWKAQKNDVRFVNGQLWQDMPINKKKMLSWNKANTYCVDLNIEYYGFLLKDFRLPTTKELKTLSSTYDRFLHKQYFNYWSSEKFMERKREYANYVGYANDGHVSKYPANLSQQVRCVHDNTLPIKDDMTLDSIAHAIKIEVQNEQEKNTHLSKPIKPSYVKVKKFQKDEFEKSSDFESRITKEGMRVKAINDTIDINYEINIKAWQEASIKAQKIFEVQKHTLQDEKGFVKALGTAMHFKYGSPLVQSVVYNADTEVFEIVIFSTKINNRQAYKSGNMLEHVVLSKKGIFSIESIENISKSTSKVTLKFHKTSRGEIHLGHYKKVEHYVAYEKKMYSTEDHDDRWSGSKQDKISIYIPKLNEMLYRVPFGYMFENKVIKLNSVANPAYKLKLTVPVKIAYAKKFKALLLSGNFKPTVEFESINGNLEGIGIAQIKDPEILVEENAYIKALGNIGKLEVFLEKYSDSTLMNKAQKALEKLKKEKVLLDEKDAMSAKIKEQEKVKVEKDKYDNYHKSKKVGDKVCMEGKMLLFMTVEISGYVEDVKNNKIQIRIADTESQSPNYNGVTLKQGTIIWDEHNSWKGCN